MTKRSSPVVEVLRGLAFPVIAIAGLLLAVRYRHFVLSVAALVIGVLFWFILWIGNAYQLWLVFRHHEPEKDKLSSDIGYLVP
jgi:hypothetical protein